MDDFKKSKEYLICVDSDGCAMDTMNVKHFKCFGPCMIEEWGLEEWKITVQERWNEINLYTMTRGINRFQALLMILEEINNGSQYRKIEDLDSLKSWVEQTTELSNDSLMKEIARNESVILPKVLHWSKQVNQRINLIDENQKKPFTGTKEALFYAHRFADIAIVSSANLQAVLEEWDIHGLLEHTDIVLAQESGSKTYCIKQLLKKGYDKNHVLMIGDAPGDCKAAKANEVCFYPILVGKEEKSWKEFKDVVVYKFINGEYEGAYEQEKIKVFEDNLK